MAVDGGAFALRMFQHLFEKSLKTIGPQTITQLNGGEGCRGSMKKSSSDTEERLVSNTSPAPCTPRGAPTTIGTRAPVACPIPPRRRVLNKILREYRIWPWLNLSFGYLLLLRLNLNSRRQPAADQFLGVSNRPARSLASNQSDRQFPVPLLEQEHASFFTTSVRFFIRNCLGFRCFFVGQFFLVDAAMKIDCCETFAGSVFVFVAMAAKSLWNRKAVRWLAMIYRPLRAMDLRRSTNV